MSKPLAVTIPHQLGRAEAKLRIEAGFDRFAAQFGGMASNLTKSWDGDRMAFALEAMAQKVSGTIDVADQEVRLEVILPGLLGLIAGKLRGRLKSEGQLMLEKK